MVHRSGITVPWHQGHACQSWNILRLSRCGAALFSDFGSGMELIAANRRPRPDPPPTRTPDGKINKSFSDFERFEFVRGIGGNYNGIMGGRLSLDFAHAVSAFFYPDINFTNPDPERQ